MNEQEYRDVLRAVPASLTNIAKLWEFFLDSHCRVGTIHKNRTELIQSIESHAIPPVDALNPYDALLVQCLQEFGYMGDAIREFRDAEIIRLEAEKKNMEEIKNQLEEFSRAFKLAVEIIQKAKSDESN